MENLVSSQTNTYFYFVFNNSVEGWHRSFQQTLSAVHPSVYRLWEQLIREQDYTEIKIQRYRSGYRKPKGKNKYVRLNERLQALMPSYNDNNKLEFLKAVAYNIEL